MRQVVDDSIWQDRLKMADVYYKAWETKYKCNILEKYYNGFQWRSQGLNYSPYTINKIFETVQIKIAQFIPTYVAFTVSSKTGSEDDIHTAAQAAQLKEDILNTLVQDPENNFAEEAEQAYKDSFFRFGMLEVGYSADWILNPNAQKPLLKKDTDPSLSKEKGRKIAEEPPELPQNERVYFKHIPAKTFRIGGTDHKYLNRCGWCGYYEYVDRDDLLNLPKLMNEDKISLADSERGFEPDREVSRLDSERYARNNLKVWHIWDLRSYLQLLVLDSPVTTVFQRKFKRLPLFDLRPDRDLTTNGFYPVPTSWHWLSMQDEYNETREMLRSHRRRFVRKFQCVEGMVDDEEIEKFETGGDGTIIKVKRENAIAPIENASLGQELNETIATSADDLNRISGTSDEARGVADRTTATQANIVNQRTALRETKERDKIAKWLSATAREVLLVVRDKFTSRVLIKLTAPEGESLFSSLKASQTTYKYITSEDLKDGYDFKINVDLTSMSSVSQVLEKQRMLEFLSVLNQFPMIAFSPYLVREAAYRIGYRNEKAIAELQQMALLMELARMNQLRAAAGQGQEQQGMSLPQNGNAGQQIVAQQTPPDAEKIRNQLQNQLGTVMQ